MLQRTSLRRTLLVAVLCIFAISSIPAFAQSTATVRGNVADQSGAVIANASVTAKNITTGVERSTQTDTSGNYQIASLPVGTYDIEVKAPGMAPQVAKAVVLNVSQTVGRDFRVGVQQANEVVNVAGEAPVIETNTITVGQVVDQRTVQEIPLNGRHFVDLGVLVAGSVTAPSNGFLTAPLRGQGSASFNTAGQREDTVNFMINGVNLNDMVQNQITFQPSINTVSEFKVDNSTYSAEYGRNSGAIVNIATRSGTNAWHGEVFEYLRNEAFDARNFFNKKTVAISPFKRNQFGANLGGPIWKNHTFFFFSYEGLRQRQGITINSGVPTAADRGSVTNPTVQNLLAVIPPANDPTGTKFIGSGTAPVDLDQWTLNVSHNFSDRDHLNGYYAIQKDKRQEPTLQGNTIPGFGDTREARRQIFTLNETHVFTNHVVNEFRFGFNRIHITFAPNFTEPATSFGINLGVATTGIPQFSVAGYGLNFGGPALFPQGRGDTTFVFSDTLSWLRGNHNFKFGGEFRQFRNNNFGGDTGAFAFTNSANFLAGNANTFTYGPGTPSRIEVNTISGYVMDTWKIRPRLTLELGLRYDLNFRPSEAMDRFVNFDPATASLVQTTEFYETNTRDFGPRAGVAWDMFGDSKTILRVGYGLLFDQPVTNAVSPLTANPPFANPLAFNTAGATIPISNVGGSLSPTALGTVNMVNPNFRYPYVQSWNLNLQKEVTRTLGLMIGYFGSKGTHLRDATNFNQRSATGVRPFSTLSASSPIRPGATLSNIQQIDSGANSNYNALWVTATKQMSVGLQFQGSYTWSHSFDYNSLSSQNIILQDSFNPRNNYGPSDFDTRHRFTLSGLYELPFRKDSRLVGGWQAGSILQVQSGNPFTIIVGNNNFPGTFTVRPNQLGQVNTVNTILPNGNVQWFTAPTCAATVTSGCVLQSAGNVFGTMSRNAVVGPGFLNLDLSAIKRTKITERIGTEFRVEAFNILNHPNFAQPITPGFIGASTTAGTFGQLTATRFPTGDAGSSRQLQFALKVVF
jgi:Carboxypeptidase regulatory-like domain